MNLRRFQHILCVALLATVSIASSGCMLSPGNNEVVDSIHSPVYFSGVTLDPNKYVYIYARPNSAASWRYIGYAKSGTIPINYFGNQWYFWQVQKVIPAADWSIGVWFSACEVRAVESGNGELLTFDAGFYSYYDEYADLGDLWNDRGHGSTATVLAGN